jgi:hypothetical protein
MIRKISFFPGRELLIRQLITAWVILLLGVLLFATLSTLLFINGIGKEQSITISLIIIGAFTVIAHVLLQNYGYSLRTLLQPLKRRYRLVVINRKKAHPKRTVEMQLMMGEQEKLEKALLEKKVKEYVDALSLLLEKLKQTTELWKKMGYSEEEINALTGSIRKMLLLTDDDPLAQRKLKVEQLEPPSKSS